MARKVTRAAIDVGTISVRLLVAEVDGSRIRPLVRRAEITRLGQGLGSGRKLGKAARQRTAEAVRRFVAEARGLGAEEIVLAGTSAAREAADGEEFIRELGETHNVAASVLPGSLEAELAYSGVSSDLGGDLVVLDIGGGSTELTRKDPNGSLHSISLALGASRATETWLHTDPPTQTEIAGAYEEARAAFGQVAHQFGAKRILGFSDQDVAQPSDGGLAAETCSLEDPCSSPILVGVAGTVITLASLDAGLKLYDPEVIHRRKLSRESVGSLLEMLVGLSARERAALPCVQRGRAPVLPGGAVVLLAAMDTLGYEELVVSERDLLEGLVLWGRK